MTELQKLVKKLNGSWPEPSDELFQKHGELRIEVINGQIETIDRYSKHEFMTESIKTAMENNND